MRNNAAIRENATAHEVCAAGFLVELISPSVTSGFTSATAVIITVAQLKGLLGLSFVAESVAENVELIAARWRDVRPPDCLLSLLCCATLLLLRVRALTSCFHGCFTLLPSLNYFMFKKKTTIK